ncbi:hypothetical protein [Flavobacterium sp. GNP002]
MEENHYRVDKSEILAQQESRSLEVIATIEDNCNVSPVQFLKNNLRNKKIKERVTEPDIKVLIGLMIVKIGTLSGMKNQIDFLIAQDILKMIFSVYKELTIEEIYKAFELERYGAYDEKTDHFQLIDAEYVAKILKKYKVWKQKIRTHHNISTDALQIEAMTESQKDEIVESGVNRFFEEYKKSKTIEDPSEYIFDHLVKKGLIKNNNNPKLLEYYQNHLQLAREQLEKENSQSVSVDKSERLQIKIDLEQIIAGSSPKILLRAKKNILTDFFEKQISEQVEKIF